MKRLVCALFCLLHIVLAIATLLAFYRMLGLPSG